MISHETATERFHFQSFYFLQTSNAEVLIKQTFFASFHTLPYQLFAGVADAISVFLVLSGDRFVCLFAFPQLEASNILDARWCACWINRHSSYHESWLIAFG